MMDAIWLRVCGGLGFLALVIIAAIEFRHFLAGFLNFVHSISPWQRVFLLPFVAMFILYGGDKNDATNEPSYVPPISMTYYSDALHVTSGEDLDEISDSMQQLAIPDDLVVTNLMFFGFRGGTNVAFGLTWPNGDPPSREYLNLYCNWTLGGYPWVWLCSPYVRRYTTYIVGSLDWESFVSDAIAVGNFPTNADTRACFMAAIWGGDSDDDGIDDGDEIFIYRTNPHSSDTDMDDCDDWLEMNLGTDPCNSDTDMDGLTDGWEFNNYFDPLTWDDADLDSDEDGLTNFMECLYGTDPWLEDSDLDGLLDTVEIQHGLDPCSSDEDGGSYGDYDQDGVSNVDEIDRGLNPCNPDTDGDGLIDRIDPHPLVSDGDFFGSRQTLPEGANTNAYCWIELVANTNAHVIFRGDGASNLPDPDFMAREGVTNRVTLLIGKRYEVSCSQSVEIAGYSDESMCITDVTSNAFSVVWPVTISTDCPSTSNLLLGAGTTSNGEGSFSLWIVPNWLNGNFYWSSTGCCHVVENDDLDGGQYDFECRAGCDCGGCELSGSYAYEGYSVFFAGVKCGCHYESHDQTTFGLSLPQVVFKDGALVEMSVDFHHGDENDREKGTLTLVQIGGLNKIRVWKDRERTIAATNMSWDVCSFDGTTFYIEGVDTSTTTWDISFQLTWRRPGGMTEEVVKTMSCAKVEWVKVQSDVGGVSPNPPPFKGQIPHTFNVEHSPNPDQHSVVFFEDVVNETDFTVNDFTVGMTLQVKPVGAPVGRASWFRLEPTPDSGLLVSVSPIRCELRNPKVGGVYHIGAMFNGSPTNECNIVLPLAGASVDSQMLKDFTKCNTFVTNVLNYMVKYDESGCNPLFGKHLFWDYGHGDYRGRPANSDAKMAWYYNQVNDDNCMGATCTCMGLPIRMAKLSNFIVGYATERMGVPSWAKKFSQRWGTKNDGTAELSWRLGQDVARGTDFQVALSNCVYSCWQMHEGKAAKQWPCLLPAQNHIQPKFFVNPNRVYTSPGFLDMKDPKDFKY